MIDPYHFLYDGCNYIPSRLWYLGFYLYIKHNIRFSMSTYQWYLVFPFNLRQYSHTQLYLYWDCVSSNDSPLCKLLGVSACHILIYFKERACVLTWLLATFIESSPRLILLLRHKTLTKSAISRFIVLIVLHFRTSGENDLDRWSVINVASHFDHNFLGMLNILHVAIFDAERCTF